MSFCPKSQITKLKPYFALDRAVLYSVLRSLFGFLSGLIIVFLVTNFLTLEQQGYYYTFYSLVGIRLLFDLGLNQVIIQLLSKEVCLAGSNNKKSASGYRPLIRFILKWYVALAVLFFAALIFVGSLIFGEQPGVKWCWPWRLMAFASAISLMISPLLSLTQGLQRVVEAAYIALLSQLLTQFAIWALLVYGLSIWAPGGGMLLGLCASLVLSWPYLLEGLQLYRSSRPERRINLKSEVFEFQGKIAVAWSGGYMLDFALTPIIFKLMGAESAAKFGLSLTLCNAVSALALLWFQVKVPVMVKLSIEAEKKDFMRYVRQRVIATLSIGTFAMIVLLGVVIGVTAVLPTIADRIISPLLFASMLGYKFLLLVNSMVTGVLRLSNDEPLFWLSALNGVVVVLAVIACAALNYDLVVIFFMLALQILFTLTHLYLAKNLGFRCVG